MADEQKVIEVTEEVAAKYKGKGTGRIPSGVKDKVLEINHAPKKAAAIKRKNDTQLIQRKRLDMFLEEFLKNGGNATDAAEVVFAPSNRASAAALGSYYLKQAKQLGRVYLESRGMGYGKLLDVAVAKMIDSKTPEWWDRLMKLSDYEDFMSKKDSGPSVVNVIQANKDYISEYVEGEIEEEEPDGN